MSKNLGEKADSRSCWEHGGPKSHHRFIKRQKARIERRRAKRDPECTPGYGKYRGWEL